MTKSARPFFAARIEDVLNGWSEVLLRGLGWNDQVVSYVGYGTPEQVRILGRVVLAPPSGLNPVLTAAESFLERRGWRNFMTTIAPKRPVFLTVGTAQVSAQTDRGGYLDVRVFDHGLDPGWHEIQIQSRSSVSTTARVLIVAQDQEFGVVCDVDDTVLTTWLPRLAIAAWNSFVLTEDRRCAVPGMANLLRTLAAEHPGAPIFYLSTGAWNTEPFLNRFLPRHRYPSGPFLLTDWGPTNTGWFRSGADHKRHSLASLAADFPKIRWILIGDDGQHDPEIYAEFANNFPAAVQAVAIRQLSPVEQILTHGSTMAMTKDAPNTFTKVPMVSAPDGRGLLAKLRNLSQEG